MTKKIIGVGILLILLAVSAQAVFVDINFSLEAVSDIETKLIIVTKDENSIGIDVNLLEVSIGEVNWNKDDFTLTRIGRYEIVLQNQILSDSNVLIISADANHMETIIQNSGYYTPQTSTVMVPGQRTELYPSMLDWIGTPITSFIILGTEYAITNGIASIAIVILLLVTLNRRGSLG